MTRIPIDVLIPAMMRSSSSCFDPALMSRRTERADLEKKPAMAVSDQGMDYPGEQINPGQQADRAMARLCS
jgi:hypothetical protein